MCILNRKEKGSVYLQFSPISLEGKENKLFRQEGSKRLSKEWTGSVGLELAGRGTLQATRTGGQPAWSVSRASGPEVCFWQENADVVRPCWLHLSSKHPDSLHESIMKLTPKILPPRGREWQWWQSSMDLGSKVGLNSQSYSNLHCVVNSNSVSIFWYWPSSTVKWTCST